MYDELWDYRRRVAALYRDVAAADSPQAAWQRWVEERDTLFRGHSQSALDPEARERFQGLRYFDYDPTARLLVGLDRIEGSQLRVDTGTDGSVDLVPFARTRGVAARFGGELTVYWIAGYGGGAFLPFLDATSGRTSYGGGRYLLDTIKGADLGGADGKTWLDFNFAYNPSCSYSARWVCPLAPRENRLPLPVEAGERCSG